MVGAYATPDEKAEGIESDDGRLWPMGPSVGGLLVVSISLSS